MDEMARVARVSKATIYNYLGSKDRVYLEVLRREADEIVDKISSSVVKKSSLQISWLPFQGQDPVYALSINILNPDRVGIENLVSSGEDIRNELFEREVENIHSILHDGLKKGVFYITHPF